MIWLVTLGGGSQEASVPPPAELLTVNYAAPVSRFLLERFASVDLVLFEQREVPPRLRSRSSCCSPTGTRKARQITFASCSLATQTTSPGPS